MNTFWVYFNSGFYHLINPEALDHWLFILVMCVIYELKDWKKLIWIISSFTIAHSISLLLSVYGIFSLPSYWVEFLIAFTIFFTAVENIFIPQLHRYRILFSGFFGLIHGLGFSAQIKSLFAGTDTSLIGIIFSFNIGIEAAQIIILTALFLFLSGILYFVPVNSRKLSISISAPIALFAAYLMLQRNFLFTN